jgi:uroporphyrinogen decarboxylase
MGREVLGQTIMTKIERVQAVLQGRQPDRPPVSFWCHFPHDQVTGRAAIEAHLAHLSRFDLDFLKVMNDNGYPRVVGVDVIHSVGDLKRLRVLDGTEGTFGAQLEVIRGLAGFLSGKVLFTTTVFSAWATLRELVHAPRTEHGPPKMQGCDERDEAISALLKEDRAAVAGAIGVIAESLANFARECIKAGANGVFLSVRDDWVDRPENGDGTYDEMVRPADVKVLDGAAAGTFNMLHVCGKAVNFEAFARYPVQVLNWADRAAGPSIAYARDRAKPALCGGVDNLKELPEGTPAQVAEQVRDAIRQAQYRPILITPGCTYDPARVPEQNLRAMVNAARTQA